MQQINLSMKNVAISYSTEKQLIVPTQTFGENTFEMWNKTSLSIILWKLALSWGYFEYYVF